MLPILTPGSLALLALLGKATLLLVAAFGGAALLQRAPAGARHLLWLATLGAVLALPAIATWSPLRLAVIPTTWYTAASDDRAPEPVVRAGDPGAATSTAAADRATPGVPQPAPMAASVRETPFAGGLAAGSSAPRWQPSAWQLLLTIWAAVACGIGAWLIIGFVSVRRIVRRATVLTAREWGGALYDLADRLGVERTPQLVRSEDVKMPFAAGLLHPTVVLPAECDRWDDARRRAVLLHELAHISRNDLLGHTLGRVACALYWFHPLVWSAARRLRLESERACDDLALSCGVRPSSYAEHLLDIVTSVREPLTPVVAIPMADRREFEGRMLAILDPDVRRQGSRRQSMTVVAGLAALALVVGGSAPAAARAASADPTLRRPPGRDARVSRAAIAPLASPVPGVTRSEAFASPVPPVPPAGTLAGAASPVSAASPASAAAAAARPVQVQLDTRLAQADSGERAALLTQVLRSDTSASIRRTAAWGLERYVERADVTTALAQALRGDASGSVREMAAWALGGGDDTPTARAGLLAALGSDRDATVRETAAWALAQVTDDERADDVERALTTALRDDVAAVRATALWAIGTLGNGKAPATVGDALVDRDPRVRSMAAWVLFRREDPATLPVIERALGKEDDPRIRVALIRALGTMGDASAPTLARLLDSPDRDVRAAVVAALAGQNSAPWPMPMPRPRPFP